MIKQQLKEAYIQAMKDKNILKKNLFGVILGEIQNQELRGIESTDENVLSVLKRMEKSLSQTNTEESLAELELIKPYLPQLMDKDSISKIISQFIIDGVPVNMGELMKAFNLLYKGKADNKIVSQVIKELI